MSAVLEQSHLFQLLGEVQKTFCSLLVIHLGFVIKKYKYDMTALILINSKHISIDT